MRCLSGIIVIFIAVLSVRPCDDYFPDRPSTEPLNAHFSAPQPNDEEEATEDCSPFCICSCCNHPVSSAFYLPPVAGLSTPMAARGDLPFYNDPYNAKVNNSIWQPPKF